MVNREVALHDVAGIGWWGIEEGGEGTEYDAFVEC